MKIKFKFIIVEVYEIMGNFKLISFNIFQQKKNSKWNKEKFDKYILIKQYIFCIPKKYTIYK